MCILLSGENFAIVFSSGRGEVTEHLGAMESADNLLTTHPPLYILP